MAQSRIRCAVMLEDRVRVVKRSDKGKSLRAVAAAFEIGKRQINNIVTARDQVLRQWESGDWLQL